MILRTQVLFILFLLGVCNSDAQEFHADMTSEAETDFKKKVNWLNLLRLSLSVKLSSNLHFDASTLSLWQTRESGVSDDYQTFSNIFADNMLIAPAVLGLCWEKGAQSFSWACRRRTMSLSTIMHRAFLPTVLQLPILRCP